MSKQTEALKMAIEFAEANRATRISGIHGEKPLTGEEVIQACKEALEQPAQEYLTRAQQVIRANNSAQEPVMIEDCNAARQIKEWHEKNTHPAPSWQGLSDDDMEKAKFYDESFYNGARWAEQALKEKNHG